MKIGQVPIAVVGLIITNDLLDTGAQLLLKKGIGQLDTVFFWAGLLIYGFNFFLWMRIIAKTDLSVALPLTSASYILIPVASIVLFHEQVGIMYWIAIGFILTGIFFVSRSKSGKEGASHG